jgi:carbon monoxide dehydrogenase subunit G
MDIEGTYTLQAPQEEVWQSLMDEQTLQHAIPGLERLETIGKHGYAFTLRIKHAPLRGVYQGQMVMDDLRYPTVYRLSLEGDGQQNTFQGMWEIHLSAQNDNTVVAYTGTLNPGKIGAFLPQPLVKGAIKVLIQQFFTNLAEQLRSSEGAMHQTPIDTQEEQERQERYNGRVSMEGAMNKGMINQAPTSGQTRLHVLVRRLGLGKRDPAQEERWVTRLKRFGAFSVLLLLVWVGTRLPRRLFPHD